MVDDTKPVVKSATKVEKAKVEVVEKEDAKSVEVSKQASLAECLAQLHRTKKLELEAKKIEEEAMIEARKIIASKYSKT